MRCVLARWGLAALVLLAGCSGAKREEPSGGPGPSSEAARGATTGGDHDTAASGTVTAGKRQVRAAGLAFEVPASWEAATTSSPMRAAQFRIPSSKGESPELVLYFFGEGQGGSADANISRWVGQFAQPDGKPSAEKAALEKKTVGGFHVSALRLDGTYLASTMPGMGPKEDRPGYRMWGAVVEGAGGPWFLKATGPREAMLEVDGAFDELGASLRPAS